MNAKKLCTRTFSFTAVLLLCWGCRTSELPKHSPRVGTSDETSRLQVLAAVFRHMGENSGKPMCLLDVTDSEFDWLQKEFSLNPLAVTFAPAKGAHGENDVTMLVVAITSMRNERAVAMGSYVSKGSFSQFRYELLYKESSWKITKVEVDSAS